MIDKLIIMMKKYIYLIVFSLLTTLSGVAQESRHEFSAFVGGGISSFNYSVTAGEQKLGLGGNLGFGYTYFLSDNWGVHSGLELAYYNAKISDLNILSYAPNLTDSEGEKYHYYSDARGYSERQHALFMNVPIMAHFQTDAFNKNRFYISGGVKLGVPVMGKFKSDGDTFVNKGWYYDRENWLEDQRFAGFGTFYDRDVKKDIDLNISCMLSLETGIKWNIFDNQSIYTGIYFDYGLNDVIKDGHDKPFVEQEIQPNRYFFTNNSALESSYYTGYEHESGEKKQITDKVVPMALGLKVRLTF